ncbi:MAG TPA: hypothetical protein VJV96_10120 [Candidatus Angelobacter sp.]|jgi:hypothetical protein|nr:hypothetical protein [Candidatus Angelobacter sp.]
MLKKLNRSWLAIAIFALVGACSTSLSAQTTKSSIENMSGWASCTACAGSGGSGPVSSIYSTLVGTPSLTGTSRQFHISSSHAYADALWWKQLGASAATHLVYDVYFYIKTPQYSQALEFDNNQANGSLRWIFGTQCNIAGGHWDVWGNKSGNWLSTGIPCKMPSAYKWHHLTWEFERVGSYVKYIALTLDGVKHYVNRSYPARASSTKELNVAFQMDMRSSHVAYSTWLDKVSLKYW